MDLSPQSTMYRTCRYRGPLGRNSQVHFEVVSLHVLRTTYLETEMLWPTFSYELMRGFDYLLFYATMYTSR